MNRTARLLVGLALSATAIGCGVDTSAYDLDAEKELLLSSVSSEREALVQDSEQLAGASDRAEPDQPRLDGDCDVSAHFEEIFARYDEDTSGELEAPEEEDVHAERDHRELHEKMRRIMAWVAMETTYDADDSLELDEEEREAVMADFTTRCEVMHARIVEDFDADGDGELSEAEAEEARAELEARRAEHRAEGGERGPEGGPEMGEGGPQGGEMGEGGPEGGERPEPPSMEELREGFLAQWDTNEDGEVDADERAAGRAEMEERIVSGAPLGPEGRCQDEQ